MIPGKKYKPEDFIEAAWRRRWFILIPLVVIGIGTMIVVERLPDRYESSATLLIVPQRIPESYVKNPVSVRIDERLMSIGQEILSRSRLESIIQEFNLYPEERRAKIMEDVVETMRTRDIIFNTRNARSDSGSFQISFQYKDPRLAQQVANRLASLFIQENTEDRAVLAELTDEFLNSQLKDAERQLKERENQLAQFRRDHPGTMPTEVDANQQGLQNAQLQLQGVQESMSRDRDRQLVVQRQIADLQMQASLAPPPDANGQGQPQSYARQLEVARAALKNMRLKLTPDHPDIKALNRTIKDLEQKAAVEASQAPVSGPAAGATPAEVARAKQLADLQTELVTIQHRLDDKQQQEKQLLASMSNFRARLEAAPTVASELTDMMRDYDTLKAQYQGLLAKSQDAKVAANLQRRQIGEQFKLIDPPRLPQRPKSPDRFRLNIMGALAGLMIGLGLAGVLEYRDTSLRTEDDVLVALSLPVLATVPTMSTDAERQRRKRHKLLLASSGAVALVLCLAAIAWKLRLNEWMW